MHYITGELDNDEDEVALSGSLTAKVKSCLHNKSIKCFLSKASLAHSSVFDFLCSCPLLHSNTAFIFFFEGELVFSLKK